MKITTSKGRFLIVEYNELTFKDDKGLFKVYHFNKLIDWFSRIKLSEITEEQLFELAHLTFSMIHFKGIETTPNTYIFKL